MKIFNKWIVIYLESILIHQPTTTKNYRLIMYNKSLTERSLLIEKQIIPYQNYYINSKAKFNWVNDRYKYEWEYWTDLLRKNPSPANNHRY